MVIENKDISAFGSSAKNATDISSGNSSGWFQISPVTYNIKNKKPMTVWLLSSVFLYVLFCIPQLTQHYKMLQIYVRTVSCAGLQYHFAALFCTENYSAGICFCSPLWAELLPLKRYKGFCLYICCLGFAQHFLLFYLHLWRFICIFVRFCPVTD